MRRTRVIEALSWCPVDRWISIAEFYRAIAVWDFDFELEKTDVRNLYVGSRYDGDLNDQSNAWAVTNGLYINVIIWEYLATIGAVDVAFLEDDWMSLVDIGNIDIDGPISRYDGLSHFRINPWGAYLLGRADDYVPAQSKPKALFTINSERAIRLIAPLMPP